MQATPSLPYCNIASDIDLGVIKARLHTTGDYVQLWLSGESRVDSTSIKPVLSLFSKILCTTAMCNCPSLGLQDPNSLLRAAALRLAYFAHWLYKKGFLIMCVLVILAV